MFRTREILCTIKGDERIIKIIFNRVKNERDIKSIGICSPSYPGTFHYPKRYKRGIEFLKNKGFTVVEGNLTEKEGYRGEISGGARDRAEEFNQLIPHVDVIMTSIGGYNSNSILKYVDYELFEQKAPIFIGYSDTTALALALYKKTGCITYLSQSVISNFGEFEPFNELNYSYFKSMIFSKQRTVELQMSDIWTDDWINWENYERAKKVNKNEWIIFNEGEYSGTLIGGNLDTIIGIIGTEYMPEITEDTILLLEDVYTDLGRVYRNFTTLALHGVFDKIGGLIVSKFETIGEDSDVINDIINEFVGHRNIPILLNFDCGHTHPSCLIPIGSNITLKLN
ncbi:LD-carboxypeptidase [Carnobacteriaceae bacterium zg-84]|uniref:S66 family peptidase n=1 Tax=Granulicatella sp. zg-84 TaxID=2678503 RepID=UPI0013C296C6|nr:S66 peptidase family protein [Granulicatella sp. zg-84]NEW66345.1 LD-carboxypeptidase [Granulicatella sp. zg-84]QMI86480.1 LD-carboxypeptidase [Carnobacteriaceae bacterium zg-84]